MDLFAFGSAIVEKRMNEDVVTPCLDNKFLTVSIRSIRSSRVTKRPGEAKKIVAAVGRTNNDKFQGIVLPRSVSTVARRTCTPSGEFRYSSVMRIILGDGFVVVKGELADTWNINSQIIPHVRLL